MTAKTPVLALVGNPNVGKTTLFNALTGQRQKVGNFPGVTVSRKEGKCYSGHGKELTLLDLPGTYSLEPRSPDERITRDVLLGDLPGAARPDAVVCVVDASMLERQLVLVSQMLELGLPVLVVLNKTDLAQRNGLQIDAEGLAADLGVAVVTVQATAGSGLVELKQHFTNLAEQDLPRRLWGGGSEVESALTRLESRLVELGVASPGGHALQLLGDGDYRQHARNLPEAARAAAQQLVKEGGAVAGGAVLEDAIQQARLAQVRRIAQRAVRREAELGPVSVSDRLDAVLLHPVLGWVVFAAVMTFLFWLIFSVAPLPMDLLDATTGWLGERVAAAIPDLPTGPGDFESLMVDGVIAGVGGVVIFLPQILLLFLLIGILETTGYMARAAFLVDGVMRKVGLNGRAFVPMLSGYACAIPGIMATRTMENPRQRLITTLVLPFQSCSARLPVYILLITTLIHLQDWAGPWVQAGLMVLMYLLGTAGALFFAWLFHRTLPGSKKTPGLLLEMPVYCAPKWREIAAGMADAGWAFLKRAGTIILALSIVIWAVATYPKKTAEPGQPEPTASAQLEYSLLGRMGHAMEPVVHPLGYDWKIGAALVNSFAAREVFVSTLNIIYGLEDETELVPTVGGAESANPVAGVGPAAEAGTGGAVALESAQAAEVQEEPASLGSRWREVWDGYFHPSEEDDGLGALEARLVAANWPDGAKIFTPLTVASLLVFYIYAMQCLATLAVTRRETRSWGWALFQLGYQTGLAYLLALIVYQGGRALGWG